ncbi:MAG: hypothetical protein Q9224_005624 [Gallowayella concinna]
MIGDPGEGPGEGSQVAEDKSRVDVDEDPGFDTATNRHDSVTEKGGLPNENQNLAAHLPRRVEDTQDIKSFVARAMFSHYDKSIERTRRSGEMFDQSMHTTQKTKHLYKNLTDLKILLTRRTKEMHSTWWELRRGEHGRHYECLAKNFTEVMIKVSNCLHATGALEEDLDYLELGRVFQREQNHGKEFRQKIKERLRSVHPQRGR